MAFGRTTEPRFRALLASLALLAPVSLAADVHALTIDVTSTSAAAGDGIGSPVGGPLTASTSNAVHYSDGNVITGAAIADVTGGHLGAAASATGIEPAPSPGASIFTSFSISDAEPGDSVMVHLVLHGSYSPGGGGGVHMDTDTGFLAAISCSTYNETHTGGPCSASGSSTGAALSANEITVVLSLYGKDSLGIGANLNVTTAAGPAYADFLNSADFTLTFPAGTVINGNPGGSLFRVPEPRDEEPVAAGLLFAGLLFGRRRRGE